MVETGGSSWHQSNRGVSIYFSIYLMLFLLVIYLSNVLHKKPKWGSYLPEATMVILVGIVAGGFIQLIVDDDNNTMSKAKDNVVYDDDVAANDANNNNYGMVEDVAQNILGFSPTVFFVILLPPIIFNSGYHLQRDLFFRHIIPISLYACVGTIICTYVIATCLYILMPLFNFKATYLELATFGALISATDPVSTLAIFQTKKVDPHLFYLVFGESVINDAVSLVLFEALAHLVDMERNKHDVNDELNVTQEVTQFLFDFLSGIMGSLVLGVGFAVLYGVFFKYVDLRTHTPFLELCIYVTIMYSPFVVAEILRLSGVVTVLFTGIAAKRYTEPNLSLTTATNSDTIFRLVAHLTETIIFLELGLSVFSLAGNGAFHIGFMVISLLLCLVGRAVDIYPITFIYNYIVAGPEDKSNNNNNETAAAAPTLDDTNTMNGETTTALTVYTGTDLPEERISDRRIPMQTAHMLWFSGLRGAVSYGLARMFPSSSPNQAIFVGVTMFIVLMTTFVLGGSTEYALSYLNIQTNVDEEEYLKRLDKKPLLSQYLQRLEEVLIRSWVIRDYETKENDVNCAKNNGDGDGDAEVGGYQQHVELPDWVPENSYNNNSSAKQDQPVRGSVYDHGH